MTEPLHGEKPDKELPSPTLVQGRVSDQLTAKAAAAAAVVKPEFHKVVLETMSDIKDTYAGMLVRGWDSYMQDAAEQPLQMLEDLTLCGPTKFLQAVQPFTANPALTLSHPLAQPALRHIRSSPLQSRPSVFDCTDEDDALPPPIPLDPFQRSTSTPSSLHQRSMYSAFGAVDRGGLQTRYSAFDPVKYYARQLEDMERTSIEVMDVTPQQLPLAPSAEIVPKRGAASRAARFLSDVRVLRRRRRGRGGRRAEESNSFNNDVEDMPEIHSVLDTSITVITEPNDGMSESHSTAAEVARYETTPNGYIMSMKPPAQKDIYSAPIVENDTEDCCLVKNTTNTLVSSYQPLDSDIDDEADHYQRMQTMMSSLETITARSPAEDSEHYQPIETQLESPGTVPSPTYEHFVESSVSADPLNNTKQQSLCIKVPKKPLEPVSSPSPTRMAGDNSVINESVTESPVTARSSVTGSSSGHTTQATSISSVGQSGLSMISETDREVMEANKEGKRRRGLIYPVARKNESDLTSIHSSSTTSSNSHAYLTLDGSPVSLRDGANVRADRFFTGSPTSIPVHSLGTRTQTTNSSSSRRSGNTTSPSTSESASGTHTSSSASSREEPLNFVSYLDRVADLISVREVTDSPRTAGSDGEEREASPAEMFNSSIMFEEAKAPRDGTTRKARLIIPRKQRGRLDKFRSRPPRNPFKRTTPPPCSPPPPRGSPLHHLSPPRNIVNTPDPSLLSRPNVMRRVSVETEARRNRISDYVDEDEEEVLVKEPKFSVFEEIVGYSFEVKKTESVEDSTPIVTPEKKEP